jgi:putative ABC transport system permease protein
MVRDLRQAVRVLVKSPGFAVVAILTLGLGIGANTAIFTVANALLLRALPFADPERLVQVGTRDGLISFPFFSVVSERNRSFAGVAAATFENFNMTGHGDPEQVHSARVSWNFFDVLGVRPVIGRTFLPEEDQRGARPVVLISYELWMRTFARNLTLDGQSYAVIGVLPPKFVYAPVGLKADIWAPRVFDLSLVTPARVNAGGAYFEVVGRLRPRVSREQAEAEMTAIYQQYRHEFPGNYDATLDSAIQLRDLQQVVVANVRPMLLILSAAVGFVLLIACANVASLLLVRSLGRRREFAVRTALGAPRWTLVRQLLVESVLLSVVSGGVGILLGYWGTRLAASFSAYPQIAGVQMDFRVLAFTLGISVVSGVVFGLTPSLQLSRADLNLLLRTRNRRRSRARDILVVAQVALSMVLLIGSGLLIRSLVRLRSVQPGFDTRNVLTLEMTLPTTRYAKKPQLIEFYDRVLESLRAIPGVQSAALSTSVPAFATHQTPALFEGQPAVVLGKRPIINIQQLSTDYAKALRIPLLAGRTFTAHDDAEAPPVALVNQTAVHRFWPFENAIGKRVWVGNLPKPFEVVGVLGDVKNRGVGEAPEPEVFLPLPQLPWSLLYVSLRTEGDPHGFISSVRREIATVDKDQPITRVMTAEELLESASEQPRFTTFVLGIFAATAFVLAAIGIYGVIAYTVAQRTQELGIRIALGAAKGDIFRLVIGGGVSLTLVGIGIGLAGALALTRVMSSFLYQTSATDPVTFLGSAVLFAVVAVMAGYLPARRAVRIDPTYSLRSE